MSKKDDHGHGLLWIVLICHTSIVDLCLFGFKTLMVGRRGKIVGLVLSDSDIYLGTIIDVIDVTFIKSERNLSLGLVRLLLLDSQVHNFETSFQSLPIQHRMEKLQLAFASSMQTPSTRMRT